MNPTTKRILFIVIVILGVIGIGFAIWYIWKTPRPTAPAPTTTQQEPTPVVTPVTPLLATSTRPAPNPDSDEERERKAREALFRRARDLVARAGTYSSADQFAAIQQVYVDASPEAKTFLESERTRLLGEYRVGDTYAQTSRALAARLDEEVAVRTATNVRVQVDVQQLTERGTQSSTALKRATVSLTKSGEGWIMTRLVWGELTY